MTIERFSDIRSAECFKVSPAGDGAVVDVEMNITEYSDLLTTVEVHEKKRHVHNSIVKRRMNIFLIA
jgi:hypothetical protein